MHIAVDHKKLNKVCKTCGFVVRTVEHLNSHTRTVHDKIHDFCCHLCPRTFSKKFEMQKHLVNFHNQGEKKHQCKDCDKRYFSKIELTNHIRKTHERKLDFHCHLCPKSFWMREYLRDHIKFVHEQYKPNKCDLCSEAYLYKRDLIKHKSNVHHIHD